MVGSKFFFILALACAAAFGADDPADKNIRLSDRLPGLYLTPSDSAENGEARNFTTTTEPLAPLSPAEIEAYLRANPELRGYRVVLIGPAVSGDEATRYQNATSEILRDLNIDSEVEVIRHPRTLRERIFNLVPRREDYEPPIKSELKVAAVKILLAEGLSFTVLLLPPILKLTGAEMSATVASIVDKIALPLGVAVPMVILDVAHMVPLISYRRFLSNHNIRLLPPERFGRQFLMSMFFSFNFYVTSQWPALWDFVNNLSGHSLGHTAVTALSATASLLSIIIPTSVFNMVSRTTVGTSLNIWEQRAPDRRFTVALLEAVTGMVIAPIYILSTMPLLEPVIKTGIANVNAAHLALLGIGAAGGAAWSALEWGKLKSCAAAMLGKKNTKDFDARR